MVWPLGVMQLVNDCALWSNYSIQVQIEVEKEQNDGSEISWLRQRGWLVAKGRRLAGENWDWLHKVFYDLLMFSRMKLLIRSQEKGKIPQSSTHQVVRAKLRPSRDARMETFQMHRFPIQMG